MRVPGLRHLWALNGNMPRTLKARSSAGLCLRFTCFVAALSTWILVCSSTAEGLLQDQYIGCFYDDNQMVDGSIFVSTDDSCTVEECIAKCKERKTTYAALQNGSVCHCRNSYGVQLGLPDSTCNLPCSGNNSEICGGFIGQQLAYSLYAVCPIGTCGAACDKGCHCKYGIPCDRRTGVCSEGCHGNWSGPACNITTVSHQYIGCFVDETDKRQFGLGLCINCDGKNAWNKNNTIQSCSQSCAEHNYSYAGLQYSWCCFCGEIYDRFGRSSNCTMACSGDNRSICGGPATNSVYSVCPAGNYGKSCTGRCHCVNDGRCTYGNGSCPLSQCKEGWTGTSCNIRDCTKNNGDCQLGETCSSVNLKYSTVSVCRCPNGFQRSYLWNNCEDIDECKMKVCDTDTMTCTNTIGNYSCSCRSGFQTYNATSCTDIDECQQNICDNSTTECHNMPGSFRCSLKQGFFLDDRTIIAGFVGFVIGAVLSVIVAFAILLIYRRRSQCRATSENKSSKKSIPIGPKGDENGHDVTHPCKAKVEDFLGNQPSAGGQSAECNYDYVNANVHGKRPRSPRNESTLNAVEDGVNFYESLNADQSGFDETRDYTGLELKEKTYLALSSVA